MATKEQVEAMLEKMKATRPYHFFQRLDETQAGTGAVLFLLYDANGTVSAGQISDSLKISTARVAALLKKMETKGLITREHGILDARVTIVKLTDLGSQMIQNMQAAMYQQMERILDKIGEERLLEFFEIAREIDPIQPLTSGAFRIDPQHFDRLSAVERYCLENSDLISYHNYGSYDQNIQILKILKRYGRPILNTEWLARMTHNTVEQMFPLFYLEKVGCWNWGFVAGLYQTYEPWNGIWQQWANGQARDVDFKVWFHDLYRPSLHPYDPHEIELIQYYCKLADADFLQEQQHKE